MYINLLRVDQSGLQPLRQSKRTRIALHTHIHSRVYNREREGSGNGLQLHFAEAFDGPNKFPLLAAAILS